MKGIITQYSCFFGVSTARAVVGVEVGRAYSPGSSRGQGKCGAYWIKFSLCAFLRANEEFKMRACGIIIFRGLNFLATPLVVSSIKLMSSRSTGHPRPVVVDANNNINNNST